MSTGALIAVCLITLALIVSIVFTVMGFVRSSAQEGLSTVQNSISAMMLSQFDDYDQKIISGSQVMSAVKLFEGRPIACVIVTNATKTGGLAGGTASISINENKYLAYLNNEERRLGDTFFNIATKLRNGDLSPVNAINPLAPRTVYAASDDNDKNGEYIGSGNASNGTAPSETLKRDIRKMAVAQGSTDDSGTAIPSVKDYLPDADVSGDTSVGFVYGAYIDGMLAPRRATNVTIGYPGLIGNWKSARLGMQTSYTANLYLANDTGTVIYNTNYIPMTRSGSCTFVRSTAKFLAELIKDNTGTIVGISFTQQD